MSFYFNNIIENMPAIDKAANFCLKPLHGFLRTFGGNDKVKTYQVYKHSREAIRIPIKQQSTIQKIIQFIIHFIFFIPCIIVGVLLKGLAQISSNARERNAILKEHLAKDATTAPFPPLSTISDPVELPPPTPEPAPVAIRTKAKVTVSKETMFSQLNESSVQLILMNYLSPHEMTKLAKVNRSFYNLLNQEAPLNALYKKIHRMPENHNGSLLDLCQLWYERKMKDLLSFHYDVPSIRKLFSLHEIMHMRCFNVNDQSNVHEAARKVLLDERTKDLSIFRMRYTNVKAELKEAIIVKFTLFVPELKKDYVWHHYFLLELANDDRVTRWKFNNSSYNIEGITVPIVGKESIKFIGDRDCSEIYEKTAEAFRKLKNKKMIGWSKFRNFLGFMRKDARPIESCSIGKRYEDVPFVLGHVYIDAFSFKRRADFIPGDNTPNLHHDLPTFTFVEKEKSTSEITGLELIHHDSPFSKLPLELNPNIFSFLYPQDLAKLREVSKVFFKYCKYDFCLPLIKKTEQDKTEIIEFFKRGQIYPTFENGKSINSFHDYWNRCREEAESYSAENPILIRLFGSIKKIMSFPIFPIDNLNRLITQTSEKHNYAICRVKGDRRMDLFVFKYTLFIPNWTNKVLHNYFYIIETMDGVWKIRHPWKMLGSETELKDHAETRFIGRKLFDVDLWSSSCNNKVNDLFNDFVSGKVIGFFSDGPSLGFEARGWPPYMEGESYSEERRYRDLPMVVGHVPAEAILFKQSPSKRHLDTNVLVFEDTLASAPPKRSAEASADFVHALSL